MRTITDMWLDGLITYDVWMRCIRARHRFQILSRG